MEIQAAYREGAGGKEVLAFFSAGFKLEVVGFDGELEVCPGGGEFGTRHGSAVGDGEDAVLQVDGALIRDGGGGPPVGRGGFVEQPGGCGLLWRGAAGD